MQEIKTCSDFFQNQVSNSMCLFAESQFVEKRDQLVDSFGSHFGDIDPADRHSERTLLQPLSVAGMAGCNPHKRLILCFHGIREGLPVALLQIADDSLESNVVISDPALSAVMDFHFLSAGSVNQDLLNFLRILTKGCIQIKTVFLSERFEQRIGKALSVQHRLPARNRDRPVMNRQGFIRNHQIYVKLHFVSQSQAIRTGAERVVKGKGPGFNLIDTDPAVRTGKALRKSQRILAGNIDRQKTS